MLNYRTAPKGSIRVELQDADGRPLAGWAASDSKPLSGDALDGTAVWSKGSDLASLGGQPVRLRFVLSDAELFSFRFE